MSTWDYKGGGMNLAEIEKEIREVQRLLDKVNVPVDDMFVHILVEDFTEGYNKLERLCEFINDMIDQDCDIYRR